ncbi:PD-(D/E)XK nuclease superfamily protein [Rhizobium sp. PP-CC-2G-626]|nr:PD-(D/E)XK nuclease superfamily protein [Rhizobium sp. PP-CC-2G-626]
MTYLKFDSIARVDEVVTDVLAMDLLHSSVSFLSMVLQSAGEASGAKPVAIRRSVADTSLGETDVELLIEAAGSRCAILIENKIRAPLMDRQFARYRMRGEAGVRNGNWQRFRVILMSPRAYFRSLPSDHSAHIDANLSYEDIVEFLSAHPEFAFKRHVFQSAIDDYRRGYVKSPDTAMMEFYGNYWAMASTEFPQLRMSKPSVVGRDGSWIYFPPLYAGNAVRLIHKFKGIGCEIAVATRNSERLAAMLSPFLEPDMTIRSTKSMAFINVRTPALDHTLDFESLRTEVLSSLSTLERLRTFALDDRVRKAIVEAL